MDQNLDTIVVFTARSPERIVREGGSQAWVLNPARAKQAKWLVCTQNRHNADLKISNPSEPHGAAFLVGKISEVRHSVEPASERRWMIAISEFARLQKADVWDHSRNPVRYASLKELGINPEGLNFEPMPPKGGDAVSTTPAGSAGISIDEAKRGLSERFQVPVSAIEITIRG